MIAHLQLPQLRLLLNSYHNANMLTESLQTSNNTGARLHIQMSTKQTAFLQYLIDKYIQLRIFLDQI